MADIEGTNIYSLTTRAKASITDDADAWIPYEDRSGDPVDTFKLSIHDLLSGLSVVATPEVVVYSASHGLTSGAVGKPIGWKADGKPYVWTDTATTEIPVAVVQAITDSNHVQIAPIGPLTEIANTLVPGSMPVYSADTNARMLYWDGSAATYKHVSQGDSVRDTRLVYWIGLKEGDANTSVCMVLPQSVTPSPKSAVANVRDFGAMQDGTTDDTAAIQAAIDSGRPIVYFPGAPTGYYKTTSQLEITQDYQQLIGDGPSSIIHNTDDDSRVLYIYGTSSTNRIHGVSISRLWLQGVNATVATPTDAGDGSRGCAIAVYYANRVSISECLISHCHCSGIFAYTATNLVIRNNWFFDQYWASTLTRITTDLEIGSYCGQVKIQDNHFHSNIQLHISCSFPYSEYLHVSGNVSIPLDAEGNYLPSSEFFSDSSSTTDSPLRHNISLVYADMYTVLTQGRCIITDNLCIGGKWSNVYYNGNPSGSDDMGMRLVVSNNVLMYGGSYNNSTTGAADEMSGAIVLHAGREILISDNLIIEPRCFPSPHSAGIMVYMIHDTSQLAILDNIITDAYTAGIVAVGYQFHNKISGNYLYNCGGRGLGSIEVYADLSAAVTKSVSSIDTGTDTITANSHGLEDGDRVRFTVSGGNFFSIDADVVDITKVFYVRDKATNTFKIAHYPTGPAINITATFTGTLSVYHDRYMGSNLISDNMIVEWCNQKTSLPLSIPAADVNATNDRITYVDHGFHGSEQVLFNNATPANLFAIGGSTINNNASYYIRLVDADTFELSATAGGAALDITGAGTGTHTMRCITNSTAGIYNRNTGANAPTTIADNVVVSRAQRPSNVSPALYGIINNDTNPVRIVDNYVEGYYLGVYYAGSITARKAEEIEIRGNYIANCYDAFNVLGTVNGLVLIDDSNRISNCVWRHRTTSNYVSAFGVLRNGKVVTAMPYVGEKSATTSNGVTNFSSTSHGLTVGDRVQLSGSIPTSFSAATNYWVVAAAASTFQLAATRGGSAITPTSTVSSGLTVTHQLPAHGTWAVGDTIINDSWSKVSDVREWVCTTAGAVGTCVWKQTNMLATTLADADTTPDVTGSTVVITANTSPATITGFDGGVLHQRVSLIVPDAFTTLKHNSAAGSEIPIVLVCGHDYPCYAGDVFEFLMIDISGTRYWREVRQTPFDFMKTATANDATPSALNVRTLVTANSSPTTVTTFDDGYEGQQLTLVVNDNFTTLDHSASGPIILASNADEVAHTGDVFEFIRFNSKWYEKTSTATT